MQMKIDNQMNFILPTWVSDRECRIIFNQPSKMKLGAIAAALRIIFAKVQSGESPDIIVVDYQEYIKESGLNENTIKSFIASTLTTAQIIFMDDFEIKPLSEFEISADEMETIEGLLLFFSALLRYGGRAIKSKEFENFFTLLNAWELVELYKKQSKDTDAPVESQE